MKRLLKIATVLMGASALAASAFAGEAHANTVTLLPSPTDDNGQITLGELFEGAGSASHIIVGRRTGASAVLDAAQVQVAARRAGLNWTNSEGIRRIIVREGFGAPALSSQSASVSATARAGATVEALTYSRSLSAGDIIQPQDVVWTQVQAHLAPASGPQDADEIIGLSARRPLRAGCA